MKELWIPRILDIIDFFTLLPLTLLSMIDRESRFRIWQRYKPELPERYIYVQVISFRQNYWMVNRFKCHWPKYWKRSHMSLNSLIGSLLTHLHWEADYGWAKVKDYLINLFNNKDISIKENWSRINVRRHFRSLLDKFSYKSIWLLRQSVRRMHWWCYLNDSDISPCAQYIEVVNISVI